VKQGWFFDETKTDTSGGAPLAKYLKIEYDRNTKYEGGTEMEAIYWLIAIIVLVVVEIFTLGLTTIWFAGGALVAFIAALLSAPVWLQFVLFVAVSAVLLLFTRPFAVRFINQGAVKTNYESMAGRIGRVTEQIDNLRAVGCVRVNGQDWTARAATDTEIIPKDSEVVVEKIDGVKLIVTPAKKEDVK
jgi:membrane protein implicated in regulation of membrane protease activity